MKCKSFDRCLTKVQILLLSIPSLSILFYLIFILSFNSIISTHLLLSLLFYFDNITTDTMNVSLSKKVVAAAISSSHGQGGGSSRGRGCDGVGSSGSGGGLGHS